MKKKSVFILPLLLVTLFIGGIPVHAAAESLEWNGIELRFQGYRISDSDSPYLSLYVRGINDTDRKVWVSFEDAAIDGTKVTSAGRSLEPHSDNGEDDPRIFSFWGSEDDPDAPEAIRNAKTLEMTVILEDNDTYEHLTEKKISLDLASLSEGAADAQTTTIDSSPEPTTTSSPEPAPTTSSTSFYRTLQQGDKGDDVKQMQEKLIELGYLNDTADGNFGPRTASAVQMFNEMNGLRTDAIADAITQDCMFSGLANAYTEPWIPAEPTWLEWNNPTADGGSYHVEITNTSRTHTIKGVELAYYPRDVWGENMWSYPNRKSSFAMTIKPGESVYTDWFYLSPSWYGIADLRIGISRIAFDDGTIREPDEISWWTFTMH